MRSRCLAQEWQGNPLARHQLLGTSWPDKANFLKIDQHPTHYFVM